MSSAVQITVNQRRKPLKKVRFPGTRSIYIVDINSMTYSVNTIQLMMTVYFENLSIYRIVLFFWIVSQSQRFSWVSKHLFYPLLLFSFTLQTIGRSSLYSTINESSVKWINLKHHSKLYLTWKNNYITFNGFIGNVCPNTSTLISCEVETLENQYRNLFRNSIRVTRI